MCQACEESNINNNDLTILHQGNDARSPSRSTQKIPYQDFSTTLPSCNYNINDETCPTNISDSYNKSINVDNSHTNPVNNGPITLLDNEHLPVIPKSPTKYANSVLSLPLPEFAKNIVPEEPTSPSIRYSLSSNSGINQATYMVNGSHDEKMNCGLDKTVKRDQKQDQNNNRPLNSKFKNLESTVEHNVFVEEAKRLQYVSNRYTPNQSQSNPKFQNQQLSSSLKNKLSTNGSSKYYPRPSTAVIKASDTQPSIISQNSKTPLLDSQLLPIDGKLLIKPNSSITSHDRMFDSIVLFLEKQKKKNCTINNSMHTHDALNTHFVNPIGDYPKDDNKNDKYFEMVAKIRYEYTKHWVNTSNWLTDKCVEQLDYPLLSDIKEKENQRKLKIEHRNKQKLLDGYIPKSSIESVHIKRSTNINKCVTDNKVYDKSIAKIVSSLNKNKQSKISSTESRDKIKSTNLNDSTSSISNNVNNIKNIRKKSDLYNRVTNKYKDQKTQSISINRSRRYNKNHIKPNKTQDEVEKINFNKSKNDHKSINKIEHCTRKKSIYFTKEKKIQDYKHQSRLGSKLTDSKSNKSYSTKSSLKRSMNNTSTNHHNSKKRKIDNKTYKNNYTNTFKHHSPVLRPRENLHNTWIPEKKNKKRRNSKSNRNSRMD
jgi:hypothetical protein